MSTTNPTLELGTGAIATVQVARQPVLTADPSHALVGYQLLFSDSGGLFDAFADVDQQRATSEVLGHAVLTLGIDSVVGDRLAFVAFAAAQVLDHVPLVLPADRSVIQVGAEAWIAATPARTDALAARLAEYRQLGYRIALAGVETAPAPDVLLQQADYAVVDVHVAGDLAGAIAAARRRGAVVIAAGVDTAAHAEAAGAAGAELLQGFFFSASDVVVGREIPGFKLAYLQLMKAAFADDVDFEELADIVKQDVALSYKLLKYINSAAFGLRARIESVHRALALLGLRHIRSWVGVATTSGLVDSHPQELAVLCATRARFCESLAGRLGLATPHACFSLGMFSLLDVLLGTTLDIALADMPLAEDVRLALAGEPGVLSDLLVAVVAYERGQWDTVTRLAARHGWPETELIGAYIDAVEWSRDFFGTTAGL